MLKTTGRTIRLESALSSASRAIVVTDATLPDNPIISVNAAFTALTGYDAAEVIGRNCRFLQGPETDAETVAEIRTALMAGVSIRRELLNYRRNGEIFWNDLTLDPIHNDAGDVVGYLGMQVDCTEVRTARQDLSQAQETLREVTMNLPGYVYRRVLKADGEVEFPYLSLSFFRLMGMPEQLGPEGSPFLDRLHPDDRDGFLQSLGRSAANLSMFREEFRLIRTDEHSVWIRSDAQPRRTPNGDTVWDGVAIDITSEKIAESELAFLALHDPLTGLSNRSHFRDAVSTAVQELTETQKLAIFTLDIHRLQEINDGLGQGVGDEVLKAVGHRLESLARAEGGIAGRLGGDEFAILLPGVPSDTGVTAFAGDLVANLSKPMSIDRHDLIIQVCLGATLYPTPADEFRHIASDAPAELIKRADLALGAAKQEGPGAFRLYAAGSDDRIRHSVILRQSLHRAVEEQQFELHYQPLVELGSGKIVGAEALLRWNHPQLGLQRPDLFIPLAEETGLIVPMGAWVMKDAMRRHQTWTDAGLRPPRIAINVSSVQLRKSGFLDAVKHTVADIGADPRLFEFELTEGLLIEPSPEILQTLNQLRAMGFWVTVDDFGTGHATFKYLRDFPVDKIKIDQNFVRSLVVDSRDASIVRAMIGLARNLGIEIVAEGVETHMQRRFLRAEGCQIGQGYLFSPPMKAEDFAWMIQNKVRLPISRERVTATRRPAPASIQVRRRGRDGRE